MECGDKRVNIPSATARRDLPQETSGQFFGANGTVTTDGANVTYTSTSGTSDAFTYTVNDESLSVSSWEKPESAPGSS